MNVGVISFCRDRLDYTKHCFASLRANAGLKFTHLIFDQGSTDGTWEWLCDEYDGARVLWREDQNIGIHRAMNRVLDALEPGRYDLLVKVDNDCELLTPGTLRAVAEHVLENPGQPRVVSPLIHGLRNRPSMYQVKNHNGLRIGLTNALGGIFFPLPPLFVKEGFRFDEAAPVWGGDDERLCAMVQERDGELGYLLEYEANHYLGTEGQVADKPEYFARRVAEGGPAK